MEHPDDKGSPHLIRGVGLAGATSLNMIDMIGVGPFITIPLIIAAMGGPQAILGWICGAVLVICDGLVWAELGAAMPGSGGSYRYLKEIYHPAKLGRVVSFLFIWQLTVSAPMSIASGCIGLANYIAYLVPALSQVWLRYDAHLPVPLLGSLDALLIFTPGTVVAMGTCLAAVFLLYRRITVVAKLAGFLWIGVMLTIAWIIASGAMHFSSERAFSFPPGAFHVDMRFLNGLGAGMLVAVYDYWGYYNVCFFGGEVRRPERTIPRAILYSILLVALLYLVMNISILGVIPWQELSETAGSDARKFVISVFMERLYGRWAGSLATGLIAWTAFASVFSLLLGYSRVPYAAALDGDFFRVFARIHPRHRFPNVSLLTLGLVALPFCLLRLADVIAALVVIRIVIQFLSQVAGLVLLRFRRPDFPRPFRMWLYPLPAIGAFTGFLYILIMRENFLKEIRYAAVILLAGLSLYALRAWKSRLWPWQPRDEPPRSPGRSRTGSGTPAAGMQRAE